MIPGWRGGRSRAAARRAAREGAFPVKDVELSLYENLLQVTFVWPGITHENVYGMAYDLWCLHVQNLDAYMKLRVASASLGL